MATGKFVSYLRVSTARQGASGLGLEAQRQAVTLYLNGGRWKVIAEFVEVESGKSNDRPALAEALAAARLHRATLVVARVDRLTRSLGFLTRLLESGVDVRFCDLPDIAGPAGRFMLQQMAAVAELEGGLISARTKAALAAAKARGKVLGGYRGRPIDDAARRASLEARKAKAAARTADLAPVIAELRSSGITSLNGIGAALVERGISAARGGDRWTPSQVARVLAQIPTAGSGSV